MKKLFLFCFFFIRIAQITYGQDPHFSQFYSNPIYLNPAFAGTADGNRVVINHRQQWAKPNCFVTSAFSIDGKFDRSQSGWGLQVLQDNQVSGTLTQMSVNAVLAHRIKLTKTEFLGFGLKFGAYQKRIDWSKLTFEDQLDDRHGIVNPTNERFGKDNIINGDVSAGILYYSKNLFGGLAANHMNRPHEDFTINSESRLAIKYTAHIGAILPFNVPGKEHFLSPNIILEKQGSFHYVNLGLYFGTEIITLGGYYRVNDAIIGIFGINYNDFKMGYSYDVRVSNLSAGSNNTHELSIAYLFEFPKSYNKKGRYKGKCPKFYKYLL
jgi:type IX secretion system PorP/SprF family membrane protein